MSKAQMMAYMRDTVVFLLPKHAGSAKAVERVAMWLQQCMVSLGVDVNGAKSEVLFLRVLGWIGDQTRAGQLERPNSSRW